jgi:hypothetical protein
LHHHRSFIDGEAVACTATFRNPDLILMDIQIITKWLQAAAEIRALETVLELYCSDNGRNLDWGKEKCFLNQVWMTYLNQLSLRSLERILLLG